MLTPPFLIPFLKLIWPMPEPDPPPPRTQPLQVLCLGLSRTGTDSLRTALEQHLSYTPTHHAYRIRESGVTQCPQWCRLIWRKYHTSPTLSATQRGLSTADFDHVLAPYVATTDIPCSALAPELILAYPNAKIVLNHRPNIDAWHESVLGSIENGGRGSIFAFLSLFDAELFWFWRLRQAVWSYSFGGDFRRNGKEWYARHYREVEECLAREEAKGRKREVLWWRVEDGWGPLCEFLGKEVPKDENGREMEFPRQNERGKFDDKRKSDNEERMLRAERRQKIAIGLLMTALLAGSVGYFRGLLEGLIGSRWS